MDAPELIRPGDAVPRFHVSASTLARWAARGHIGTAKVGGVRYYVAGDIEDLQRAPLVPRTVAPSTPPAPVQTPPPVAEPFDFEAWVRLKRAASSRKVGSR